MANNKNLTNDQIISLLAIYESEWQHRNEFLWSQMYKLFYISIFIMVIPNISNYLLITLPNISLKLFPHVGMFSSTISLLLSLSYSKRLKAISDSYDKVNECLPKKYRRIKLSGMKNGKYFTFRHTVIAPIIMYIIVIIVGVILCFQ